MRIAPEALPRSAPAGDPEAALRAALGAPGVELAELRRLGDGAWFAEARFESLAALCRAPLFGRDCAVRPTAEGLLIEMAAPTGGASVFRAGAAEIRIRPEGQIESHNSPEPIQRGNVLVWRAPFDQPGIRVVTARTSVFRAAAATVLRAVVIAAGLIGVGLFLVWREGRRRLLADPEVAVSRRGR